MRRIVAIASLIAVLLAGASSTTLAQVSGAAGIGEPNVNLSIRFGSWPRFAPVPGYPVYYAPQVDANYFFYDGMYWVFQDPNWYASSWYNGPWGLVSPYAVPVYLLQVPVQYYRLPPPYFRGWRQDAPPRWGEHWGPAWVHERPAWDRVNRGPSPVAAPLPSYQQRYFGKNYPSYEQQRAIGHQDYDYQPHEPVVQQHYQRYESPGAQAPRHGNGNAGNGNGNGGNGNGAGNAVGRPHANVNSPPDNPPPQAGQPPPH